MATGRHTVVTSFSPQGYEDYAKDFLTSFREFWPSSVRLVLYLDRPTSAYPEEVLSNEFTLLDAENMPEWDYYYGGISRFPMMLGDTPSGRNIQYDAAQARKAFIEADACKRFGGKVFWIDSDVITHAPVSHDFLDSCMPNDKLACFLGRDGWFYTESGFLGFNNTHNTCATFLEAYLNVFKQGYIFTQSAWHDCIGFDMIRRVMDPALFNNLAAGLPHGTMHPFVNSVLGSVMDHRKGNRKKSRSTKEDLVAPRSEAYWASELRNAKGEGYREGWKAGYADGEASERALLGK